MTAVWGRAGKGIRANLLHTASYLQNARSESSLKARPITRPLIHLVLLNTSACPAIAGLLAIRTLCINGTFAVGTSLAARTDAVHAAAHQVRAVLHTSYDLWPLLPPPCEACTALVEKAGSRCPARRAALHLPACHPHEQSTEQAGLEYCRLGSSLVILISSGGLCLSGLLPDLAGLWAAC
jgi:hypothetical protein